MRATEIDLAHALDDRGLLVAAEWPAHLPFVPVRTFLVTKSPAGTVRGGHAHRTCHQVLLSVSGRVEVEWDDSDGSHSCVLDDPVAALHIPPLVWAKETYLDEGSALLVLASHVYDAGDYVDDRSEAARLRRVEQS